MKKVNILTRADIILAVILIIIGVAGSLWLSLGSQAKGSLAAIYHDSKLVGTYPLNQDKTITVKGHGHINKVTIKDRKVAMTFSDCKNQDCVHMGKTDSPGKRIVCLPNRVVVEVLGEGEGDYDAISN